MATPGERPAAGIAQRRSVLFVAYAGLAAFSAYFAMYAFRKPFTAATFSAVEGWDFTIDFKIVIVIAQLLGYALSKLIGVKFVSEMPPARRAAAILALIGLSWLALVAFAILPPLGKVAAMFMNGLPLGMIWGLVFGYVEGRRTSEVLAAMLCASFIVSSGLVKSVGSWLMEFWQVSEFWMPAATGALFLPVLLVAVAGLASLPPPDADDIAARVARPPLYAEGRRRILAQYGPGITLLVLAYVIFTAIRDFRDNFAAEIWEELGYGGVSAMFSASEVPIAVVTLVMLASLVLIRNNRRAVVAMHGIVLAGAAMIGLGTAMFQLGWLGPVWWMILSGLGLYFAYTPFNAMLFDRLVAAGGTAGTASFLIYVADASGYGGSIALMLLRNLPGVSLDWLGFFVTLAYVGSAASVVLMLGSAMYFRQKFAASA
jgi:hypothetical protein